MVNIESRIRLNIQKRLSAKSFIIEILIDLTVTNTSDSCRFGNSSLTDVLNRLLINTSTFRITNKLPLIDYNRVTTISDAYPVHF